MNTQSRKLIRASGIAMTAISCVLASGMALAQVGGVGTGNTGAGMGNTGGGTGNTGAGVGNTGGGTGNTGGGFAPFGSDQLHPYQPRIAIR